MERLEHVGPNVVGQGCMLCGNGEGPFVDHGMRSFGFDSPSDFGHWAVCERCVKAMARVLDLPSGRDVSAVDSENGRLRDRVTNLEAELEVAVDLVKTWRTVLALDGIPTPTDYTHAKEAALGSAVAGDDEKDGTDG